MNYMLITNNPLVIEKQAVLLSNNSSNDKQGDNWQVCREFNDIWELFSEVRSLLQQDWKLLTHPLPANGGLIGSPFRSLILAYQKAENAGYRTQKLLDEAEERWRKKYQAPTEINNADKVKAYQKLDLWALESSLKELKIFEQLGGA